MADRDVRFPTFVNARKRLAYTLHLLAILAVALILPASTAEAGESISVAYSYQTAPFQYTDEKGQPAGMMIDLWKLWSMKTGTKVDFIPATWFGSLEMVREGKADAHAGLFFSKERDAFLDYGPALAKTDTHVFYHESLPELSDGDRLLPYRVGVIKDDLVEEFLRKELPSLSLVPYTSYDAMMADMKSGLIKVIAADTPSGLFYLRKHGLSNAFQLKASSPLYQSHWYAAVQEGKPDLLKRISTGYGEIDTKDMLAIVRKWSGIAGKRGDDTLVLAMDRNYPPFYFVGNDGKPQGLFVDIWKLWSEHTGTNIDFRPSDWSGTMEALKSGEADLHAGLFKNAKRAEWIDFTMGAYEVPNGLYFKADSKLLPLEQMRGKRVGAIADTYHHSWIEQNYPEVEVVPVADSDALIVGLLKGTMDAFVNESINTDSQVQSLGLRSSIARYPKNLFNRQFHGGVRKDNAVLLQKVNEGLKALPRRELANLEAKWIVNPENRHFNVGTGEVDLTSGEDAWLRRHPTIRVSNEMDWPPYDFMEHGAPTGFSVDVVELIARKIGLNIEWVNGHPWKTLVAMAKEKQIDVLQSIARNEAREKYLDFTESYHTSASTIFTRPADSSIDGIGQLKGKRVAVVKGFSLEAFLKSEYPDIVLVEVDNTNEGLTYVSLGKADAYIDRQTVCQYYIRKNNIPNVVFASLTGISSLDVKNMYMGVRKDWPELTGILNKGIAAISEEELNALSAKWFGIKGSSGVGLTKTEKDWIKGHRNIRLGADASWPPIEYFEAVTFSGLSAQYVNRLARDTGLSFAQPPILNWEEVVKRAQDKKLDVLPAVVRTPERSKHLAFTKPYAKYPMVVYQRTNAVPVKNMTGLDGMSVATIKGYASEEFLRDNHPDVRVQSYLTLEKAAMALSKGMVDALVDTAVSVEYIKHKRSLFNIAPTIRTPYIVELRFGVRKDWPQLVRIIDQWLLTLGKAERQRLERAAGITFDERMIAEQETEAIDYTQLLAIGGGIILVFGIALICLLFLRRFMRSKAENLYSSHQYKVVGIVVGILFLCLVAVVTWFALAQVETKVRDNIADALESVLLTTHEALAIWQQQNRNSIVELAEDPVLRGLTTALLSLPEDEEVIQSSPQLWNLRKYMTKKQSTRGFVDFAVVSKSFLNYATADNPDLLDKNIISILRPRILDKAFLGSAVFIPPITLESDHDGKHGTGSLSIVSLAAPIKGQDGKVIAVLVLNYDASRDYQRIIALGRMGITGETYAFDKYGSLISESRFDDLLQDLGLIEEGQKGILNLRIADPGGNLLEEHDLDKNETLPLTLSVKSATERKSGNNVDGYRDYRGVPVYGAWLWDEELGIGLTTEIDESEALGPYRMVRNTVVTVILITLLLGFIMTGLSNWIGQSAAKSLSKAKDELEDRVEERTAELKKISVAVEQSPATVVITDTNGTIEYVNPTFTEMTGYTWNEAIGQNPRVLQSGYHSEDFYRELWTTILQGNVWNGDFLNKRKNGQTFWERAAIAPIFGDEGEITHFVAVKEDITDRKAQEERFQSLLDAAPDAVVLVAGNGDISLVNIATEELFGYTREEMIGQKVEMLLPDNIRSAHPEYRDRFFATPGDMSLVTNKNFFGQTKDGDPVPVDISLSPIETDEGIQIIASIRDITERKKAEQAIAESEERTRLILSSAGEGIFGVNLKGETIFINEAACEMLQYTSDELLGKSVHDIIHHTRPDGSFYPVEECPMRHAFSEGLTSRIDDEVLWRKDGSSFEVEYSAVPVKRGAEMIGAVISFQDITERKAAERERDDAYNVITSSIQYASRIQRSVLPPDVRFVDLTADHFVLWEPRDVVGGDMYWCELWGEGSVVILGDCTGHGVPGAFMTLLTTGALKRALSRVEPGDCAGLISAMHVSIQKQLGQNIDSDSDTASDDGLELGACYLAPDNNSITFAGARMPLFIDNGKSIEVVKGDKKGIAYRGIPADFEYTNKDIRIENGTAFIMTTDGIIDQVGGEKRRGFGKKRFIALLESLRHIPLQNRGDAIYEQLKCYQGEEKRRDDVSIIGFKI